jgi:predicted nucleotidyltransferase
MSNQTYKELSIPYFRQVFEIIDEVLQRLKIPYYLIGVSAIALELLKQGKRPGRGTKDIDFAIMISNFEQFEEVIDELKKFGFNKVKAPWTIYHPEFNVAVDLLPFGEIEENDTINFNERNIDIHVLGFKEVLENTQTVKIEDKIAHIPSLQGMVILKLVSWSDRPEERVDDPQDVLRIIENYFNHNWDEIVEFHNDTFHDKNLDELMVSARVLGRKAAEILKKSKRLETRVLKILEENTSNPSRSAFAKNWVLDSDWTMEYAIEIINELKTGIKEKMNKS